MQKFSFKAINENGETITDVVEAESIEMANSALLARGYIHTKITPEKLISSKFGLSQILERFTPINTPELILFTKQFRTLLRAGVSIINILQVLDTQTENPSMKKIIRSLSQNITEGSSLHDAFKMHPNAFSPLYCGMVHAGESS